MTMEKTTMNEDVFPIKNCDFPASHVSFPGSNQRGSEVPHYQRPLNFLHLK